jgi:hypothetical protein
MMRQQFVPAAFHPAWRPAPMLAQAPKPPSFITTTDFGGFVTQAKSSVKIVADIARAHDLTGEERQIVDSEVNKISGYTIPMAQMEGGPSWLTVAGALILGGVAGAVLL